MVLNYMHEVPVSSLCTVESLVRALRTAESSGSKTVTASVVPPTTRVVLWVRNKAKFLEDEGRTLSRILADPNRRRGVVVSVERLALPELLAGTPMGRMREKDWGSTFVEQNKANAVRMAIVYKHGGAYLDSDIVVIRNPNANLFASSNVVCEQRAGALNNAAFKFAQPRHPFLAALMERFVNNFQAVWAWNGPKVFQDVFDITCRGHPSRQCPGLTKVRPHETTPVDFDDAGRVFINTPCDQCHWRNKTNVHANTTLIHLFNHMIRAPLRHSCQHKIYNTTVIANLQREACPISYAAITRRILDPGLCNAMRRK